MENIVITKSVLEQGMSDRGGWSNEQLMCLGVSRKNNKGWKKRLIGSSKPARDVERFLALKNAHLANQRCLEFKKTEGFTEQARAIFKELGKITPWDNLSQQEQGLLMDYAGQSRFTKADLMFVQAMEAKIKGVELKVESWGQLPLGGRDNALGGNIESRFDGVLEKGAKNV